MVVRAVDRVRALNRENSMANGPVEIDAITRITELTGRVVEDAETVQLIDLSEAPFGDGQLDLLLKFPVCAA